MNKVFPFIILFIFIYTLSNAAQLPQGMCAKPSTSAIGSTTDSISYYFCSPQDVPSEEHIRDSLVKMLIKINAKYIWFDINILKKSAKKGSYHLYHSYDPYLFGFIDDNNKMFIQRAYNNDDQSNKNMREKLKIQYLDLEHKLFEEARKNGTLKFEDVRQQKSQMQNNHNIDSRMQNRINNLGQRLR